jgi:predicted dehydrogenase
MKFGIVGYGSIAKKHIQAINSVYTDSTALVIRRSDDESIADLENVKIKVSTNLEDLADVDYILITNPTFLHVEVLTRVLKLGKPLFIEKPLADSLTDIEKLIAQVTESKIQTYVACNLRFRSCFNYLKEKLLPNLRINEINVYCGSFLPDWRPGTDFRKSYSSNKDMGGGVHLDLVHEMDYCYYLFGKPLQNHGFFSNSSSLNISAVDYAHYYWKYSNFSIQITLNYFRKDSKRTLEIVADDATYTVDIIENRILKNGASIYQGEKDVSATYKEQIKYFVENVKNQQECFNNIDEAYQVLKLSLNES